MKLSESYFLMRAEEHYVSVRAGFDAMEEAPHGVWGRARKLALAQIIHAELHAAEVALKLADRAAKEVKTDAS